MIRWLRQWHSWLAAVGAAMTAFLAVTGVLINHPELFGADHRVGSQWQHQVAAEVVRGDRLLLIEELRAAGPILGRLEKQSDDGEFLELQFAGPKGSTDVSIDYSAVDQAYYTAELYVEQAGTVAWLGHLHRGKSASFTWKLALDVVAVLVLISAISGVWLLWQLPHRRVMGLVLVGAGVLIPVLLMFLA